LSACSIVLLTFGDTPHIGPEVLPSNWTYGAKI
jgi:hypothetical protein